MKINDNEKVKFIILSCLIVAVLAFGIFRAVNMNKKPVPQKNDTAAIESSSDKVSNDLAESDDMIMLARNYSQKARDPFAPQMAVPSDTAKPQPSRPGNMFGNMKPLIPSGIGSVPPFPFPNINIAPTQQAVAPELPPNLKLVGVVEGNNKIAVIHGDNNTRHIVKEGQSIDGKYIVKSISRTGVRIESNRKIIVLKLGGNDAVQNRAR
ncbi:MAG: hypothetical protein ACYC27_15285 [Armatimonadota bacterium]